MDEIRKALEVIYEAGVLQGKWLYLNTGPHDPRIPVQPDMDTVIDAALSALPPAESDGRIGTARAKLVEAMQYAHGRLSEWGERAERVGELLEELQDQLSLMTAASAPLPSQSEGPPDTDITYAIFNDELRADDHHSAIRALFKSATLPSWPEKSVSLELLNHIALYADIGERTEEQRIATFRAIAKRFGYSFSVDAPSQSEDSAPATVKIVPMELIERLRYQGIHTREWIIERFADYGFTVTDSAPEGKREERKPNLCDYDFEDLANYNPDEPDRSTMP